MTNTINPSQNDTWQFPVGYEQIPAAAVEQNMPAPSPQEIYATADGSVIAADVARSVVAEAEQIVADVYAASPEGLAAVAANRAEKGAFERAALERAFAYSERVGMMQEGALINEGTSAPADQ